MISKTRAVVGASVLRGRTELTLALPEPAFVDVEVPVVDVALRRVCGRCGCLATSVGSRLRSALSVAQPDVFARGGGAVGRDVAATSRRCPVTRTRGYAESCLELGGTELPGAERAARELVDVAPFRESAHLFLMRALAARGNVAEALAAYERLRILLRDELGADPGEAVQEEYVRLLG